MNKSVMCTTPALLPPMSAHADDGLVGNAEEDEKTFRRCAICHAIGSKPQRPTGPTLNGVVGRDAASIENFKYSDAMKASGLTWDKETLTIYLANPREMVKGTRMNFPRLKTAQEIADVISFLEQFKADGTKM